jgi:hypothetical protein
MFKKYHDVSSLQPGFKKWKNISATPCSRGELGLPSLWSRVTGWLKFAGTIPHPAGATEVKYKKKCPEIPSRKDYSKVPDAEFWKYFPTCSLPEKAFSRIYICRQTGKGNNRKKGTVNLLRPQERDAVCQEFERRCGGVPEKCFATLPCR